jgi:hypothetical protein
MASSLRAQLENDAAHDWDVNPGIALAVFLAPFVGAAAVILARADKSVFRFLTREDSLLEWAQFVGFVAAGVLAALAGRELLAQKRSLPAITFFVFALGCLAIAGEEIAWGQRLLDYNTPERLEEINEQRETTVHNIGSVQDAVNIVFALVGLYGSVGAWLLRLRRPRWALRPDVDLLIPPLFLTSSFFVVFGYKALRFAFFPESGYTVTKLGEWPELCLAFAFAAYSFLTLRRLRAVSVPRPGRND